MNIALIAENSKKELMVQFCIAYCRILFEHNIFATRTTGKIVTEATGLHINCLLPGIGGEEQVAARCAYNEIDLVLLFHDTSDKEEMFSQYKDIIMNCDKNNIPLATNVATAEVLVLGLSRGDLAWREIVNPQLSQDGKKK